MKTNLFIFCTLLFLVHFRLQAQNPAPSQPINTTPYGRTGPREIKLVMDRVLNYVDQATPVEIVNRITAKEIVDLKKPVKEAALAKGTYSITSHEWGLAYTGMLLAGETTGDRRFTDYVSSRF